MGEVVRGDYVFKILPIKLIDTIQVGETYVLEIGTEQISVSFFLILIFDFYYFYLY